MISVLPFVELGVHPVIVGAVEHFSSIFFQIVESARKGPVDARLGERLQDMNSGQDVPRAGLFGFVILGSKLAAVVPTFDDGLLPGLGQGLGDYVNGFHFFSVSMNNRPVLSLQNNRLAR